MDIIGFTPGLTARGLNDARVLLESALVNFINVCWFIVGFNKINKCKLLGPLQFKLISWSKLHNLQFLKRLFDSWLARFL